MLQEYRGALTVETAFSFFTVLPNRIIINPWAKPAQPLPCRAQRGNDKGAIYISA
jgi:hypothetical protein